MSNVSGLASGASALQSAQLGISRGMSNLNRDAQVVADGSASDGVGGDSMTNALVDAKAQGLNVEANARALSIVDNTLGTLLDIKA